MSTKMKFLRNAALAVGILCSPLSASDDVLSQTPDPVIRLARVNEGGSLTVLVSMMVDVTEERATIIEQEETRQVYERTDDGLKLVDVHEIISRQITYVVQVPRLETREFAAPAGSFTGYNMKGETIDPTELATRLKKAIPVVISAERKNVIDPLYLQLFNPKTILLVVDSNLNPDAETPAPPFPPAPEVVPAPPVEASPSPGQ